MLKIGRTGWLPIGTHEFPNGGTFEVAHRPTPNRQKQRFADGRPLGIVEHYTAHRNAHGSAAWLANAKARASAHAVIGDKDELVIIQQASFLDRTWHAGDGRWKGKNPNNHFIGLEHSCAGLLKNKGGEDYTWYGYKMPHDEVIYGLDHNGREQTWDDYDLETIIMSTILHEALAEWFKDSGREFIDCVGHSDVAPTKKWDPGPHFPMARMRSIMGDREGPDTDGIAEVRIETPEKIIMRSVQTGIKEAADWWTASLRDADGR